MIVTVSFSRFISKSVDRRPNLLLNSVPLKVLSLIVICKTRCVPLRVMSPIFKTSHEIFKEAQKSFFPYEYNRFELYLPFDKLVAIKAYKQYVDSYLQWIKGLSQDDFYKHFKKLPNFNNRFEICMDMYDSIQYQSEMQKIIKKYCKECK